MKAYEDIALEYHIAVIKAFRREIGLRWKDRRKDPNVIRFHLYIIRLNQWAFDDLRQKIAGRDG